jgi:outer membrane protein TolC
MIQSTLKLINLAPKILSLVIVLTTGLVLTSQAQSNPQGSKSGNASFVREASKELDLRDKLVQLAMQNPNYEAADRKVAVADYQVRKSKMSWLSSLTAAYNINQFNLEGANSASFYPKYNFGLMVPLDIFTRTGNDIKIAKQNLGVAQAEKNIKYREIKAKILTKYEDYLMYQQKLEFQSQITQDEHTAFLTAEKAFGEGNIKQEEYNKAYRGYSEEKSKMAELQRNYNVIKIELEELVGMTMEDVMRLK